MPTLLFRLNAENVCVFLFRKQSKKASSCVVYPTHKLCPGFKQIFCERPGHDLVTLNKLIVGPRARLFVNGLPSSGHVNSISCLILAIFTYQRNVYFVQRHILSENSAVYLRN